VYDCRKEVTEIVVAPMVGVCLNSESIERMEGQLFPTSLMQIKQQTIFFSYPLERFTYELLKVVTE
jgi:hypothetical protein